MLEEVGSFLVKEERIAGGAENSLPLFCLDFFFNAVSFVYFFVYMFQLNSVVTVLQLITTF